MNSFIYECNQSHTSVLAGTWKCKKSEKCQEIYIITENI